MPVRVISRLSSEISSIPEGSTIIRLSKDAIHHWQRELHPANMGPVESTLHLAFPGKVPQFSRNLMNAVEFSKVYSWHLGKFDDNYFRWVTMGFNSYQQVKLPYPDIKEEYSIFFNGNHIEKLGKTEAYNKIFLPLYRKQVVRLQGYHIIKRLSQRTTVYLVDFSDGNREYASIIARLTE